MNNAQQQQAAPQHLTDAQPGASAIQQFKADHGRIIDTEHRHMDIQPPTRIGMIDCEVSR